MREDDLLEFLRSAFGRIPGEQPEVRIQTLADPEGDDPEAFLEAFLGKPLVPQGDYLERLATLYPQVPIRNLEDRLTDPQDSIEGLLEIGGYIQTRLKEGKALNRSARLLFDCLVQGGVDPNHPSLKSGNNTAGSSELREYGYIVRVVSDPNKASLLPVPRVAREALTKRQLFMLLGYYGCCARCGAKNDLQADHKVPVEIAGATETRQHGLRAWQLLCRSCNGQKRSACNKCSNNPKNTELDLAQSIATCNRCSWGNPKDHDHTATDPGVRVLVRVNPQYKPEQVLAQLAGLGMLAD